MRLLHIDIETRPAKVYTWTLRKQTISVDQIIEPTSLLCFTAMWHDEPDKLIFYKSVRPEGIDYRNMVKAAHALLTEADAVCHFNGTTFDLPRLNQEFLLQGLPPTPPIPQIDLKRVIMSKFDMISSRLAFAGPYLKLGKKVEHEGWMLWVKCLAGEKEAWEKMEAYNKQDVVLLRKLYVKTLPWIDAKFHPNRNLYGDACNNLDGVCPRCESTRFQHRGYKVASTYIYKQLHCLDCGHWFKRRGREKIFRAAPVK